MAEPTSAAAAGASMTPVAGAALAAAGTASLLGVEYGHVVAGIAGGVISLWFAPGISAGRAWISIVAGTAFATYGGPIGGPLLVAATKGIVTVPAQAAGNFAALMLGTFATDIMAGGRGVLRALPVWLYERFTGKRFDQERGQ